MKRENLRTLSLNALLLALLVLLGLTPLGLIPLGFINITILCIPVLIAAIALGKKSALVLGFGFGTVSMLSMIGVSLAPPSGLASALFLRAPLYAIIMCYVPRLVMPLAVSLLAESRLLKGKNAVLSAVGSLINTVLYLGLMLLFYGISGLDMTKIIAIISGTALIAGSLEAAAAAIIVPQIVKALKKYKGKEEKK